MTAVITNYKHDQLQSFLFLWLHSIHWQNYYISLNKAAF